MKLQLRPIHTSISTLILTSSVLACSGESAETTSDLGQGGQTALEGDDDDGEDDPDSLGADAAGGAGGSSSDSPAPALPTTPFVTESFPADGGEGFLMTDSLVITFDQPMDQKSVEEAYSSEDVLLQSVDFSWNEEGTVLTINPVEDLSFDSGEDLDALGHFSYSFAIGIEAKSAEGLELETPLEVEFKTARGLIQVMSGKNKLTGSVRSTHPTDDTYSNIWVGDSAFEEEDGTDGHYYGVVSFDMDELPTNVVAFDSATLKIEQALNVGTPYASLQTEEIPARIWAIDVNYGTERTFQSVTQGLGNQIAVLSTELDASVSLDVTDSVAVDYEGGAFSQFAFRFQVRTDEDDAPDNVEFSEPELEVLFFVP